MNDLIADILASRLIALPFITTTAGTVYDAKVSGGKDNPDRVFPISSKVYKTRENCFNGTYKDLIPTSDETGIVYFEGGDESLTKRGNFGIYKGSLKLIAWLNRSDICKTVDLLNPTIDIKCSFDKVVELPLLSQDSLFEGRIKVTKHYSKNTNPFERYSYDESQRQFLIHPFDFFTMRIEYTVYASCDCAIEYDTRVEDDYIGTEIENLNFVEIYNAAKTDGIY